LRLSRGKKNRQKTISNLERKSYFSRKVFPISLFWRSVFMIVVRAVRMQIANSAASPLAKKYWLDSGVLACSLLLNDWLIVIADVVKKHMFLAFFCT
jgi:hypothetical protein